MTPSPRVIVYTRVSTDEQGASGLGLDAQLVTVHQELTRRGWGPASTVTEVASAKDLKGRPLLAAALESLDRGDANVLLVAKLDRLSRSLVDFAGLMERARTNGWSIVALDLGVDLTTPAGELLAGIMASTAQWERRIISERTTKALAAKRAKGQRLGRPVRLSDSIRERIVAERSAGRSLAAIANGLNAEGIPTAQGGRCWYPATISKVLQSVTLDAAAASQRSTAAA